MFEGQVGHDTEQPILALGDEGVRSIFGKISPMFQNRKVSMIAMKPSNRIPRAYLSA